MKAFFFFFLILCATTANTQDLASDRIARAYPIETSKEFNNLDADVAKLYDENQDGQGWSPEVLKTLQSALQWTQFNGNHEQRLLARFYMLLYYNNHVADDDLIKFGEELLADPFFLEMKESVIVLLSLKSAYWRKGFYQKQLNILNALMDQNKKFNYIGFPSSYAFYNELGLVYYHLGQYELARDNFILQSAIFNAEKDYFRTSSMYNNIGLTYFKQKYNDSALIYYKKALQILENKKIRDNFYSQDYVEHFTNVVRSNVVKLHPSRQNISYATNVLKKELQSSKKAKEYSTAAQAYQNLSEFYYEFDSIAQAKRYNDSSLYFQKKFPNPVNKQKAYLLRAKLALRENENEEALEYFMLSDALKDSLNRAKDEKNFSEATAKYNFVQTGQALKENKKLLQQKVQANTIQFVFLCIFVILGLIIGWMLFKSRKANALIAKQKEELHKGLKEKEVMLDEIHHRIKNNLQVVLGILELQKGKISSKENIQIYEESQGYLHSMSMIHEHLYEQDGVSKLDIQVYLNRLCELLINSYPNMEVEYKASAPTVQLSIKKATPLALIICELITNSLKHAFQKTGKIEIELTAKNGKYTLFYRDNGTGFLEIDNPNFYNTGLNLIKMLIEDLEGEVEFYNENGFHCRAIFKD
ncbi:tetratricopeptide repeat protein [Aequorivita sp. H23M31]|uniref:histidine kinase n=1 Tax=Aequorivita ciconiae TaxID=2494375 RepID=A0A410G6M7_9FLAO|nr:histidine kinase dimerization/phosphoacceptor domain -containing protein [Aequorivita sp. H23M31]QAA82922.1 tetratricopeptide repeat protein [Aequorivita sp. H23M31]